MFLMGHVDNFYIVFTYFAETFLLLFVKGNGRWQRNKNGEVAECLVCPWIPFLMDFMNASSIPWLKSHQIQWELFCSYFIFFSSRHRISHVITCTSIRKKGCPNKDVSYFFFLNFLCNSASNPTREYEQELPQNFRQMPLCLRQIMKVTCLCLYFMLRSFLGAWSFKFFEMTSWATNQKV